MDVVTIGETMALFTPDQKGLMRYAPSYSRKFGGAESNMAIGLSRLGHQAGWISRVGDDELGKAMLHFIRGEGVDTSHVTYDTEAPTGLYFKEFRKAGDIRVQYYRKGSAASRLSTADIDENYIKQADYLHISGITPALSSSCRNMLPEAVKTAKEHGVTVVFDPNLRRSLWSEEEARRTLLELAALADIVLPGIDEGDFLFGTKNPDELGRLFLQQGAGDVVLKAGSKGTYHFNKNGSAFIPSFDVETVVDPVGAGDGFAAGYLSGLIDGLSAENAVQRGNAVGALVTQAEGDVEGLPEPEDVDALVNKNSGTEDVRR
ncbi:sugar kinase [Salibacterium halotolerans]|uniref:2-dehydro-3-deoxygluconokinase n=1 Tax=Salibacterium halotolerans TaxID=1884432 RepID=A0A1I5L777_9BACI|nr:sugar kinase [Salibacterium halotolerans]SFO93199.1 2-dehydro-3-deoxygluconokinase [Salibacterium halotolerans]